MKIQPHKKARTPLALAFVLAALFTFASAASAHDARPSAAPEPQLGQSAERCVEAYQPLKSQGLSCRTEGGLWKVKLDDGSTIMTHGADPADLATGVDAPAVANANARTPLCPTQNANGNYYMVAIVAWPSDRVPNETDAAFRTRIRNINGHLYEAAVESGSPTGADFVFDCTTVLNAPFGVKRTIRVDRVPLPTPSASADFSTITDDLRAKGYNKTNEKYVVYYDDRGAKVTACGQGGINADEQDAPANANNTGPSYAISYDCSDKTILHELGHNLGAVQYNAPHSTGSGRHCWESLDIMCYNDGGDRDPGFLLPTCLDFRHFDCGHDDYFDAKIGASQGVALGSYLDRSWNLGECYVRWIVNRACVTIFPTSTVIQTGSLAGGNASRLAIDDDSYFVVTSVTVAGKRKTAWYGSFTGVPNSLRNLQITYKGKTSPGFCSQSVAVWNWTTHAWITQDTRLLVGTAEADVGIVAGAPWGDFVSGTSGDGEVRVRVACTDLGVEDISLPPLVSSGDLMKIAYVT
jgi:hypothetical protein